MKRIGIILIMAVVFLILISPLAKADEIKNFIKVSEPKDNFMTSANKILITGETVPESNVIIFVNGKKEAKEFIVGAAGIFMTQVSISSKENIITVKASYPTGDAETVSHKVYQLEDNSGLPRLSSLIQTLKSFLILR